LAFPKAKWGQKKTAEGERKKKGGKNAGFQSRPKKDVKIRDNRAVHTFQYRI